MPSAISTGSIGVMTIALVGHTLEHPPQPIHPNDVGNKCSKDVNSMLLDPTEIPDAKIKYIAQYLTDDSIIQKNKEMKEKLKAQEESAADSSEAVDE